MIKPFTINDYDTVITLMNEFYQSDAVLHSVPTQYFENTFQAVINQSPLAAGYLIYDQQTVAGYGLLSFTHSNESGGLVVLLEEIYIRPKHQGKGLGKSFLSFVEKTYPQATRFRLEVCKTNSQALKLYTRTGYQPLEYQQLIKDIKHD